jgi:hypothetical protein
MHAALPPMPSLHTTAVTAPTPSCASLRTDDTTPCRPLQLITALRQLLLRLPQTYAHPHAAPPPTPADTPARANGNTPAHLHSTPHQPLLQLTCRARQRQREVLICLRMPPLEVRDSAGQLMPSELFTCQSSVHFNLFRIEQHKSPLIALSRRK